MTRITGRSAFLSLLKDEGITHLFGNPGTTELPIMHALKDHPELTYVMAMQESLVVAMADGFNRASGRLVACNVHVAPGLVPTFTEERVPPFFGTSSRKNGFGVLSVAALWRFWVLAQLPQFVCVRIFLSDFLRLSRRGPRADRRGCGGY
jgi:hypothetical protein